MGVFSRMRDIVNANLNSMLEKAEDPEKLIKLMIMEMEDTLVEIKASAAGVMASRKKSQRELAAYQKKSQDWGDKAALALSKDREDLAREALREKQLYLRQIESKEVEVTELDNLVDQYHQDILLLEEKLTEAREKHRVLVQRHIHAQGKKQVQKQVRRATSSDAMLRFDQIESRVDRMEAEADLINVRSKPSLEEQFHALAEDEVIEKELAQLKAATKKPKSNE